MTNQVSALLLIIFLMVTGLNGDYNNDSPEKIFLNIERTKIETFSKDDLLKSGVDPNALQRWIDLLKHHHDAITKDPMADSEMHTDTHFVESFISSIEEANRYVVDIIKWLHNNYSGQYEGQLPQRQSDIDQLRKVLKDISYYKNKMETISEKAIDNLRKKSKEVLEGDTKDIMPKYKKVFKSFDNTVKVDFLTDKAVSGLDDFFNKHGLIDMDEIRNFLDKLEKIILIQRAKIKNLESEINVFAGASGKKIQKALKKSREKLADRNDIMSKAEMIIKQIKLKHDGITTTGDVRIIGNTQDKPNTVFIAESGTLASVLDRVKREVEKLLPNPSKAETETSSSEQPSTNFSDDLISF